GGASRGDRRGDRLLEEDVLHARRRQDELPAPLLEGPPALRVPRSLEEADGLVFTEHFDDAPHAHLLSGEGPAIDFVLGFSLARHGIPPSLLRRRARGPNRDPAPGARRLVGAPRPRRQAPPRPRQIAGLAPSRAGAAPRPDLARHRARVPARHARRE